MATFRIKAHTKVEVWQDVTYEVEAESLEEAKKEIERYPKSTATGFDNMDETENVLFVDFGNSGNGEDVTIVD